MIGVGLLFCYILIPSYRFRFFAHEIKVMPNTEQVYILWFHHHQHYCVHVVPSALLSFNAKIAQEVTKSYCCVYEADMIRAVSAQFCSHLLLTYSFAGYKNLICLLDSQLWLFW